MHTYTQNKINALTDTRTRKLGHKQIFKCLFIFVTSVSRFFVTKHSFILNYAQILCKSPTNATIEKLIIKHSCKYLIYVTNLFMLLIWCFNHKLGECMALWGEPNKPSIQHQVYIFRHCVDS